MIDQDHTKTMLDAIDQIERIHRDDAPNSPSPIAGHLLSIAQSARGASATFRAAHRDLPWALLLTMGDILERAGDELSSEEIEATVRSDLPELKRRLLLPD